MECNHERLHDVGERKNQKLRQNWLNFNGQLTSKNEKYFNILFFFNKTENNNK